MSALRLDLALGALALSMAALAVRRSQDVVSLPRVPAPVMGRAPDVPAPADGDSLDTFVAAIADHDPFRLSNQPSSVPFTVVPVASAGVAGLPAPPVVARPRLVLKAIIGGPPWQAVIDGIPGAGADAVVSTGGTFDKLRVTSVTAEAAVVQGPDTTWTLTLRSRP